jgi:hypothetical protein
MSVSKRVCTCAVAFSLMVIVPSVICTPGQEVVRKSGVDQQGETYDRRAGEIERLRQLVAEVQPSVAELAGFPEGEPVDIGVMTRAELREYIIWSTGMTYPHDELHRRCRCLALVGLLPEGYDLVSGLVDLVGEQAGGLYDPHGKAFNGILNLPPALRAPQYQKLIASHELTHALQDRMIDILAHAETGLTNLDYEYGLRAVIEGMATVVMLAYTRDLAVHDVPDARSFMRAGFEQNSANPAMTATARTPEYLKELLISAYAEGGAFVQAWHRANPDLKLADLLRNMPSSSEQVLHPEKYLEPDEPTPIDLDGVDKDLPEAWSPFYANTLGEFDLLTLFSIHDETSAEAAETAGGWDGLGFRAFENQDGQLVLLGSSVWDSEQDAEEFRAGFSAVLAGVGGPDSFSLARNGTSVHFVIGSADAALRQDLLSAVIDAT